MNDPTPIATSSDHDAMAPYLDMIETIMGGAKSIREAKQKYLPKFENERAENYDVRCRNAKFTNIFRDIVENLAQRPFAKEVSIKDDAPDSFRAFVEDVDGQGNHLHHFAGEAFFRGIANAVDWILVDYTSNVPTGATREVERQMGVRPYWVSIPARNILAVYSDMIDGQDQFTHVRIHEPTLVRDGYAETTKNRVRVLNREPLDGGGYGPATFEVFEERTNETDRKVEWVSIEGPSPISIGVIPLVPFITGRRVGGSWRIHPPMQDAAYLQIEHYQQESALKHISTLTAFPMLAGNGVTPPVGDNGSIIPVPVGPQAVLYAPPNGAGQHGEWAFIEPGAESLKFLASQVQATAQELRELGRQPLTAQSGNLTVVTTAFAAQKGNAAIQAWALNLKDALEQAFVFTGMWLKESFEPEVVISADFDLGLGDEDTFPHVLAMGTGDYPLISREATLAEAKRRGILAPEYDEETDLDVITREGGDE